MTQTNSIDINPAAHIADLDDAPMRRYPTMALERPYTQDEGYRKLAYSTIVCALVDFAHSAYGYKGHEKVSIISPGKPKRLSSDEVARAVELADGLAACPVFGLWCDVLGQDAEALVDGVLRKIVDGKAICFPSWEHVADPVALLT
jgi:hypothetical protein